MKKNNKNNGFTLIELIIVIAIIAILAAIAIPKFGEVRKQAAINIDISNAKIIAETTAMLIAEGKITTESDNPSGAKSHLVVGDNDGESGILTANLQSVPKGKYVKDQFRVEINTDSTIRIFLYSFGENPPTDRPIQVFPRPKKGTNIDYTDIVNPYAETE